MAKPRKKLSPEQMRKFIHSLRGSLKRPPGEKPFAERWAEHKAEEAAFEEAKFQRWFGKK